MSFVSCMSTLGTSASPDLIPSVCFILYIFCYVLLSPRSCFNINNRETRIRYKGRHLDECEGEGDPRLLPHAIPESTCCGHCVWQR